MLGYLSDGSVWSDWFLPGLHHGLGVLWPPARGRRRSQGCSSASAGGASGRCCASPAWPAWPRHLAWLVAPTSASGPDGMPHGFESGLRYLAPALVLGLALLPLAPPLRDRLARRRCSRRW